MSRVVRDHRGRFVSVDLPESVPDRIARRIATGRSIQAAEQTGVTGI